MCHLYRVLAILAVGLLIRQAVAQPVRITVDASKSLGPVNPLYRDFAQGGELPGQPDPDYLVPLIDRMKALRPRLVRIDHLFDFYCKCEVKDGKLKVDFTDLDRFVDSIIAMGAKPLMCLSYTPEPLQHKSVMDLPNNRDLWLDLVRQTVHHFNIERKLGIQYWEMWNEPNSNWFWHGDLAQYLDFYMATAKAVTSVDPTIKFGGPAGAGFPQDWIKSLIDRGASEKAGIGFISWHEYHDMTDAYVGHVNQVRDWLSASGINAEILIDEWNYDAGMEPENDDNRGAVYVAKKLCKMMNLPLAHTPFFEIKDGPDKDHGKRYWGRWGLFTSDNHPKANYYAFVAFSRLDGDKLKFEGGTANVGGIAIGSDSKLGIILYNTDRQQQAMVDLGLAGLGMPKATVRRSLIDATHSNPVKQGNDSTLEQVETQNAIVSDGKWQTSVMLPPSSVTLLEITAQAQPED